MSWVRIKLGDFLKNRENRFKPYDNDIKGLKRIDKIDFSGKIYLSDKPSNTDMILVKKGDLVISGINVEKGAMAVYAGEENVTATIHYSSYSFDNSKIDIEFLKYYLKSPEFKNILKEQVPGGIKTEIKPKHLLPLEVYIPSSIKKQRELIEEFKRAETASIEIVSEIAHQQSLLKQLRQAFLREAMQGKLVKQDKKDGNARDLLEQIKAEKAKLIAEKKLKKEKPLPPIKPEEIPFEIPDGWVWCRLGDIATYSEAGKSFKCEEVPILHNEWGVLKVSAVSWDEFLEEQNKKYSALKPDDISSQVKIGDFLISRANTSELVGKSVVVNKISKNLLLSDKTIRFKFSNKVSSQFINLCNNSQYARSYYSSKATGSSPTMKNITRGIMKNLLIPLPSLAIQHQLVIKLEHLTKLSDELQLSIAQTTEQNKKLLQQVLREMLQ